MTHLVMDGRPQTDNKRSPLLVRIYGRRVWLPTRLYYLLKKLADAQGKYVPTKDLKDSTDDNVHLLISRLRRAVIGVTIINDPRKGYRIL